jgi:AcrR family transcriptional regulator
MEPKAPAIPKSARERLLAAANELFYSEGINTVGIDRIIERAGVAKASLYDTFGSKEELIRAYLAERDAARRARIEAAIAKPEAARDKILAVFDYLAQAMTQPGFRGCYFQRANAELRAASPARTVCSEGRAWTLALFTRLAKEADARQPKKLAQQLVILYDGALASFAMDADAHAAANAKAMARAMLEAELT